MAASQALTIVHSLHRPTRLLIRTIPRYHNPNPLAVYRRHGFLRNFKAINTSPSIGPTPSHKPECETTPPDTYQLILPMHKSSAESSLTIEVGQYPIAELFEISKDLIFDHSGLVKSICFPWKNNRSHLLSLPRDHPLYFGIFFTWILHGTFEACSDLEPLPPLCSTSVDPKGKKAVIDEDWDDDWDEDEDDETECHYGFIFEEPMTHHQIVPKWAFDYRDKSIQLRIHQLLQLWFMGAKFQAPRFQDAIIDALLDIPRYLTERQSLEPTASFPVCLFSRDGIKSIYENTPEGSPLRKLAAELGYRSGPRIGKRSTKMWAGLHEFCFDMLQKGFEEGAKEPWKGGSCDLLVSGKSEGDGEREVNRVSKGPTGKESS